MIPLPLLYHNTTPTPMKNTSTIYGKQGSCCGTIKPKGTVEVPDQMRTDGPGDEDEEDFTHIDLF